jgi:hypothetical protein
MFPLEVTRFEDRQISVPGSFIAIPVRYIYRMPETGKILVIVGLVITAIGLLLWSGLGKGWLGHLPGDVHYTRNNFSFHFPIVTCLIISALLTLLLWLFKR